MKVGTVLSRFGVNSFYRLQYYWNAANQTTASRRLSVVWNASKKDYTIVVKEFISVMQSHACVCLITFISISGDASDTLSMSYTVAPFFFF